MHADKHPIVIQHLYRATQRLRAMPDPSQCYN